MTKIKNSNILEEKVAKFDIFKKRKPKQLKIRLRKS